MITDGVVAFVKRACPTCTLIEAEMRELAGRMMEFSVVSQDDPGFPGGVTRVVDDRELEHSWRNQIEATPTLIRFSGGRETDRVVEATAYMVAAACVANSDEPTATVNVTVRPDLLEVRTSSDTNNPDLAGLQARTIALGGSWSTGAGVLEVSLPCAS